MEDLSGNGDQCLELCFVSAQQCLVEGPEVRVSAGCDEGGHVEGAA
jgi:hypothetical protein